MKNILLQVAIGDYRQYFVERLVQKLGSDLIIVAGDEYFAPSLRTRIKGVELKRIHNWFIFKRRLCVQMPGFSLFSKIVFCENLILDGNPRVVSTWFLLIIRRILLRRTVLWMHAWPRAGRHSKTDRIRGVMRRMASGILLYTYTERDELVSFLPQKPIWVAPNALYLRNQFAPCSGRDTDSFLYVGRLVAEKKVNLLLESFELFASSNPSGRIVIVGDGPMLEELRLRRDVSIHRDRIVLAGHVAEPELLYKFYDRAICSLSPGYVGLSITQSLFYGRPMIISRDEPHAPEIEAANSQNSVFFETNSSRSLAEAFSNMWSQREFWSSRSLEISNEARARYSVDTMVDGIIRAFENRV